MTQHSVEVERNVPARTRDDVVLRADIYRPKDDGAFPVLLCRTPYGKTRRKMHPEIGEAMAARGYIVVHQDVRGRRTFCCRSCAFLEGCDEFAQRRRSIWRRRPAQPAPNL